MKFKTGDRVRLVGQQWAADWVDTDGTLREQVNTFFIFHRDDGQKAYYVAEDEIELAPDGLDRVLEKL